VGRRKENLSGQRFSKLIALYVSGEDKHGRTSWLCVCDCGNLKSIKGYDLKSGNTKSCGCWRKDFFYKHGYQCKETRVRLGYSKYRLYNIWIGMKSRCNRISDKSFKWYGQRGISVCPEWGNNFMIFRDWAMANGYKNNLTIDRINGKGNYEPNNCQWLTRSENSSKR